MRRLLSLLLILVPTVAGAAAPPAVLCYGDSIAFVTCPVFAAARPDLKVTLAGVPGDRSTNFARFTQVLGASHYGVVVIFATTNDIIGRIGGDPAYPPAQTARNLMRMARAAGATGARVVLLTPTPVNPPHDLHAERQRHTIGVAHELIRRAERRDGITLVDVLADFARTGWTAADGLHPDAVAANHLAALISDVIPH